MPKWGILKTHSGKSQYVMGPETGGPDSWTAVCSADLTDELYEALKATGGITAEMVRSELHLGPDEQAPPLMARVEAALARYEEEVL